MKRTFLEVLTISIQIYIVFNISIVKGNFFTSITHMNDLVKIENMLIANLNKYISSLENKLQVIKEQIDDFERSHVVASTDPISYLANPINAFLIISRLTTDWKNIEKNIPDKDALKFIGKIKAYKKKLHFPNTEDFNGTIDAIIRLKKTYNLRAENFTTGIFNGKNFNTELLPDDCYLIGKHQYNRKQFYEARTWLMEAVNCAKHNNQLENVPFIKILKLLSLTEFHLGNIQSAVNMADEILNIEPNNQKWMEIKINFEEYLNFEFEPENEDESDKSAHYEELCRGENGQSTRVSSQLKCKYIADSSPFLKIAPLKLEELSVDPYLVKFHNILYDSEIEWLKSVARPRLQRSKIKYENDTHESQSEVRIGKYTWLKSNSSLIDKILKRVEDMTGLTTSTAELLQIFNYGIGGHYEPHCDFASPNDKEFFEKGLGNRIATVLFYLSDISEGGGTVFLNANVNVQPEKGSAIFWFNLLQSGEPDFRTKHAGCPVLIGDKWIGNLWLREKGQEFLRLCQSK